MKKIISCVTLFMLAVGVMKAEEGYQSLQLINTTNSDFILSFPDLKGKVTPASITVGKNDHQGKEIKANPKEQIPSNPLIKLQLAGGTGGPGISFSNQNLSAWLKKAHELEFKYSETSEKEPVKVKVTTKVVPPNKIEMTIMHFFL